MTTRLAAADRRRELMRAATVVFAQSNYRAARVGDITAEAGVSEPVLYRHFASKKELFCELLDHIGRRILAIWQESVADAPDALEALRRVGRVYVANLARHPQEAKLQFQALAESDDPEIAEVLRINHRRYVGFFERLLDQGRAEGVFRRDVDPHAVAWMLDGMGVAFTVRDLLLVPDTDDGSIDQDVATIESVISWLAEPDRVTGEANSSR